MEKVEKRNKDLVEKKAKVAAPTNVPTTPTSKPTEEKRRVADACAKVPKWGWDSGELEDGKSWKAGTSSNPNWILFLSGGRRATTIIPKTNSMAKT